MKRSAQPQGLYSFILWCVLPTREEFSSCPSHSHETEHRPVRITVAGSACLLLKTVSCEQPLWLFILQVTRMCVTSTACVYLKTLCVETEDWRSLTFVQLVYCCKTERIRIRIRNTSLSPERKLVCYSCSFYSRDREREKEEECAEWKRQHLWICCIIFNNEF